MSDVAPGFAAGAAFEATGAGVTSTGGVSAAAVGAAGAGASEAGVPAAAPDFSARILARISAVDSFGSDMTTLRTLKKDRACWAQSRGEVKRGRILATALRGGNLCESLSPEISQSQDLPQNRVLSRENQIGTTHEGRRQSRPRRSRIRSSWPRDIGRTCSITSGVRAVHPPRSRPARTVCERT